MTANPLDIRLAHLEGAYEQISDRLNGFDLRFARIEDRLDQGFNRLYERIDRTDERIDSLDLRMDREFGELRRMILTGAVTIGGFILVSIVLPLVLHR